MADMTAAPVYNPLDPAFRADPYPFYDELRSREPAHLTPYGMVVLTRYEDVATTLRDPAMSRDVDANGAPRPDDPVWRRRRERRRDGAKSILNLDPPDHTRLRRLVNKAFTPPAIEALRVSVEQMVDDVLDRAAERGEFELVDELAFPVPFEVISDLLAIPKERGDEIREWSQVLTATLEPTTTVESLAQAEHASAQLVAYLVEIVEERRDNLGDDVLSALLVAEEEGDRLTTEELLAFVVLLYVAGHETTVNLIGNGTLALLRNRDQLARWRDDPGLDANAVDELLRFDGPVQHTVRIPVAPTVFGEGDGAIEAPAGSSVLCVLGAANHDPSVFADPHRLDLTRANANRHLAFSGGIHYCLGASLARLEASVAIGRLIRRFDEIELLAEPTFRDRLTIRGVDRMPLAVRT
ncbi:MAG: cytochrome P450 [Ilumatobacteraceae bacterium]|nr:cytochrome P450 [Ilumatobacteraceae bacterium]